MTTSLDSLSKDELLRYSRQLMVSDFGIAGQLALKQASVCIIGAGGLGSAVAVQLAAMGTGQLVLIDHDTIETTNLHRQTAYKTNDVGHAKVESLQQRLLDIAPHTDITVHQCSLTSTSAAGLIGAPSIVIDGSDNFACRFAVNAYCVAQRLPLVSAAAIRQTGQLISFTNQGDGPCYQCVFAEQAEHSDTCSTAGVLPPVVSIMAAAQAMAAVQLLCQHACPSLHQLHRFDLSTLAWRSSRAIQDPNCTCCTQ